MRVNSCVDYVFVISPWKEVVFLMVMAGFFIGMPVFNGFGYGFLASAHFVLLLVFWRSMKTGSKENGKLGESEVVGLNHTEDAIDVPAISIIKPLPSNTSTVGLYLALESFFVLHYPSFELVFVTDNLDSPAIKMARVSGLILHSQTPSHTHDNTLKHITIPTHIRQTSCRPR